MSKLKCWVLLHNTAAGEYPTYYLVAVTTEDGTPIVLRNRPLWYGAKETSEYRLADRSEILSPDFSLEKFVEPLVEKEEVVDPKSLLNYYEELTRAEPEKSPTREEFEKMIHGSFIVYDTDLELKDVRGRELHFRRGLYGWSSPDPPPRLWPLATSWERAIEQMVELYEDRSFVNTKDLSSIFVDPEVVDLATAKKLLGVRKPRKKKTKVV